MTTTLLFSLVCIALCLVFIGFLLWRLASTNGELKSKAQLIQRFENQIGDLEKDKKELQLENKNLSTTLTEAQLETRNLEEKLEDEGVLLEKRQRQLESEFKVLVQKILDERSDRLAKMEKEKLEHVLEPFRQNLRDFKEQADKAHREETDKLTRLDQELKRLTTLSQQLDEDARGLTSALKGDNKAQGNWGEWQLEKVLRQSGLEKGIHFETQASFSDGQQRKQPDFLVHLPEDKHLVIDAKVSLKAYEQFCSADNPQEEQNQLSKHIDSIKNHIKSLGSKEYQAIENLKSPDYILMFIPIEPAFSAAFRKDDSLYQLALDNNVVVVTTSTLLATMRTVSFIWTQENQRKNVLEIARQGGLMYDRLHSLLSELQKMGNQIDSLQNSHETVMKKVHNGKGNLMQRAEKMKKLGAQTSKSLPNI